MASKHKQAAKNRRSGPGERVWGPVQEALFNQVHAHQAHRREQFLNSLPPGIGDWLRNAASHVDASGQYRGPAFPLFQLLHELQQHPGGAAAIQRAAAHHLANQHLPQAAPGPMRMPAASPGYVPATVAGPVPPGHSLGLLPRVPAGKAVEAPNLQPGYASGEMAIPTPIGPTMAPASPHRSGRQSYLQALVRRHVAR